MFNYLKFLFYVFFLLESSGRFGKTSHAFIFSLNNSEGLAPFVSKVKAEMTTYAIKGDSCCGPKFGGDLHIYLDHKTFSKANLGVVYSVPASVKDKGTILKGPGQTFSPDEVEVFYLDPSR